MGFSAYGRSALMVALAAILGGCGEARNAMSGAVPQGILPGAHSSRTGSWMKPQASGSDLVYVGSVNSVYVYTYPGGKHVGTLTGLDEVEGLCSDTAGNVWITNADNYEGNGYLVEYAHGGANPIATLADSNNAPQDCSVDATNGNLAVADIPSRGYQNQNIAVYTDAQGSPTHYSTKGFVQLVRTIAYDGSGNIYFASYKFHPARLPSGNGNVMKFGLRPNPKNHRAFRWDGQYLAVMVPATPGYKLIRYSIQGSRAKQISVVRLSVCCTEDFWISGSGLVAAYPGGSEVYIFKYPAGGNPTHTIKHITGAFGVTISVAPSAARRKR